MRLRKGKAKKKKALLLPLAGGKGGTGKSLLAVNLGLALARQGKKTLITDLDLGGSNIHTFIGQKNTRPGIGRLLVEKGVKLDDLVSETPWPDLFYIPGDNQVPQAANPYFTQKKKIINGLKIIEFDVVLNDLGAGTSLTALDFFLMSSQGLLVCTPELPSMLNAYSFLRQALFRALFQAMKDNLYARQVLEAYRASPAGPDAWTIEMLIEEIANQAPGLEKRARDVLDEWRPGLVLNQVRKENDLVAFNQLLDVARAQLSVAPVCLGALPYDEAVLTSVNARRPVFETSPQCPFSRAVDELTGRIETWKTASIEEMAGLVKSWGLDEAEPRPAARGQDLNQLLAEMLPVVDDLSRAVAASKKEGQEAIASGLEAILKSHLDRLAKLGLKPVPVEDCDFDPNFHQAVAVEKESGAAKGSILSEVRKGFTLHGRLFRAAQVVVAE